MLYPAISGSLFAAKKIASLAADGSDGATLGRSGAAGGKVSVGEADTEFEFRLSTCAPPVPSETARTR